MEVDQQPDLSDHPIQLRSEEWRMELERMQKIKLFSAEDCIDIEKKRTDYEMKISNTQAKEDLLKYIQFEMNLFSIIRARRERLNKKEDIDGIDSAFVQRVIKLFQDVVLKFKDDVKLWLHYFKFCKEFHMDGAVRGMMTTMLKYHGNQAYLWKFASDYAIDHLKEFEKAREYLRQGLKKNPNSKLLYTEKFRLELELINRKKHDIEVKMKGMQIDDGTKKIIRGERALTVYKHAMKVLDDVDFHIRCIKVAKEYPNTAQIENEIFADMKKYHSDKELTWDEIAKRAFVGQIRPIQSNYMEIDVEKEIENSSLKGRINASVEVYQEAVKKINTTRMWSLYLEHLIQLDNDKVLLPALRRKLLRMGLESALVSNRMEERYYIKYLSVLEDIERTANKCKAKKIQEVLTKGTTKYPRSFVLWEKRLINAIKKNNEEDAKLVFEAAMTNLESSYEAVVRLKLYKYMVMYYQLKDNERVKRLFEDGIALKTDISQLLKPMYIEWLVLMEGIGIARGVFRRKDIEEPPCLELFQKMAGLEAIQPDTSMKAIRMCHELATKHFGKTNPDVWMDYVKFELKFGERPRVDQIKMAALKDLEAKAASAFQAEFDLYKDDI